MNNLKFYLKGNLVYLFISLPIIFMIELIFPSINSGFEFIKVAYEQQNYSSAHIDVSKLIFYLFLLVYGFAFVNKVTLKNRRKRMFKGNNQGYKDIVLLVAFGVLLYFTSAATVLLGKYDYDGFCSISDRSDSENFKVDFEEVFSFNFMTNFLNEENFSEKKTQKCCIFPSVVERTLTNFLFYVLPFFIGLNFTHIPEVFPSIKYLDLNWYRIRRYTKRLWALFCIFVLFVIFSFVFHFINYYEISKWKFIFYVSLLFSIVISIALYTYCKRDRITLHLHHSSLMIILIPFINLHCIFDMLELGVFTGVMVEGACRWGISNIFEDKKQYLSI